MWTGAFVRNVPSAGVRAIPSATTPSLGHGLVKSPEQVGSLRVETDKWEAIAQAEAEYWEARAREDAMAAEEAWP